MMVIFVSQVMDQESKNHSRLKQMSCSHESGKFAPRAIGYECNFVIARLVSNFVYGGITLPLQLLLIWPSHTWLLDSELSCTILEISEEWEQNTPKVPRTLFRQYFWGPFLSGSRITCGTTFQTRDNHFGSPKRTDWQSQILDGFWLIKSLLQTSMASNERRLGISWNHCAIGA